jgi:putative hemolysin
MPLESNVEAMFDLVDSGPGPFLTRKIRSGINLFLMKLTGLEGLRNLYLKIRSIETGARFMDKILTCLGVKLEVSGAGLSRIPKSGPLVVVANHPYGGVEAAALASLLLSVRHDVKFLANHLLARVPELESLILPVDPFHSRTSAWSNLAPIKRAIQWVRSGRALAIFPAGEVAHYQLSQGRVSEAVWQASIGQLIRCLKAPVLPVFFAGRNSLIFQMAGLLDPRIRTALLVHEFLNKRGRVISARIGRPIPFSSLKGMPSSGEIIEYLRHRTFLLAAQKDQPRPSSSKTPLPPVSPQTSKEILQKEVDGLPTEQKLTRSGELEVLFATYDQIPRMMQEIGRLRELTFREAGEGSGKPEDLDEFDASYTQLFIWNHEKEEVVGAYRMGQTDLLLASKGKEGFYTNGLFDYPEALLQTLSPGIELGRSFVCPEYQRSYLPLLLLWRGIGAFLCRKPWYRYLFGAVSMSARYQHLSRELLATHLSRHHSCADLACMVHGRNPLRAGGLQMIRRKRPGLDIRGFDELSDIISDLEPDSKGVPILFRKYLELGGQFLAFHQDPEFNQTLDGFVFVDLPQANRRLLDFYLGKEGAVRYLAYHGAETQIAGSRMGQERRSRDGGTSSQPSGSRQPALSLSAS